MELSTIISVLALLMSLASVFYAKKAADQAAWSNRVNLHGPRKSMKSIYEGLIFYRHLFGDYDIHPNDEEIQNFYVTVAMPARLYFSSDIADEIHQVYSLSFTFFKRIEDAESENGTESKWDPINQFKESVTSHLDKLIPKVIAASELGNT